MSFDSATPFWRRPLITLGALLITTASQAGDAPATLDAPYEAGQLMSIISVVSKPGDDAAAARGLYARTAFGLAGGYGLKPHGNLNVTEVIIGEFKPEVVVFYAWPSAEVEAEFDEDPAWAPIKATRPDGWTELRIHDRVVDADLSLRFSADKSYTMASAWVNPENPEDYDEYLRRIEPTLNAIGGRFVLKVANPAFSSMGPTPTGPSRLTFVEWDSEAALNDFLESDGFKANASLLTSGTSNFELMRLAVPARRASGD